MNGMGWASGAPLLMSDAAWDPRGSLNRYILLSPLCKLSYHTWCFTCKALLLASCRPSARPPIKYANPWLLAHTVCVQASPAPWEESSSAPAAAELSMAAQAAHVLRTADPQHKAHLTHVYFRSIHTGATPVGSCEPPERAPPHCCIISGDLAQFSLSSL